MRPSISIVIANKNGGKKLEKCLRSIVIQNYPKKLIEVILVDGGSSDSSKSLAKKYKAKFLYGGYPENQEARRFLGYKKSRNQIIAVIDTDNYLPSRDWLRKMIAPLENDKKIIASQPLYYAYRKRHSIFNRYFSLFGFNDPVAHYLGKADRLPYFYDKWHLRGIAKDMGGYYDVTLSRKMPTVGSNGFFIRKSMLKKVLKKPESLFHIDIIYDLVLKGYNRIAFVKTNIIHETGDTLTSLVKKRVKYFRVHSNSLANLRRYKIYDHRDLEDNIRLFLFVIYSLTLIKPLIDSIRGFVKKPDLAWFLHPVVCLSFLVAYALATAELIIKKTIKL